MPKDLPISNGNLLLNFDADYRLRDIYFPGSVATFGITRESPLGGPRYTANPNTLWIRRV